MSFCCNQNKGQETYSQTLSQSRDGSSPTRKGGTEPRASPRPRADAEIYSVSDLPVPGKQDTRFKSPVMQRDLREGCSVGKGCNPSSLSSDSPLTFHCYSAQPVKERKGMVNKVLGLFQP